MLAITVLGFTGCDSPPDSSADRATNAAQMARLQRHFGAVDGELRAADVSHLTAAQREAREASLERLRRYAARGQFPHNHERRDLTPVFIDEHGTRCAMAHLIEEADGAALVATVARRKNLAFVPELAGDPSFRAPLATWLDRNGLTAAEAARIQPAYNGCEFEDCSNDVDRAAVIASVGLAAANGALIAANLRPDAGNGAAGFGLLVGAVSIYAGHAMRDDIDERRELQKDIGLIDMGLGAATVILSIRTLTRSRAPASVAPTAPVGPGGWSVSPIVGQTRGLALSGSF